LFGEQQFAPQNDVESAIKFVGRAEHISLAAKAVLETLAQVT